jgi:hypothetical protein
MRRFPIVRVTALLGLLLAGAAPPVEAAAWWGWLDKLSGPGPFDSRGAASASCPIGGDSGGYLCFPNDPLDVKYYAALELAWWNAPGEGDFPNPVDLFTAQGVFYVPLANLRQNRKPSPLNSLDVGMGLGYYRFSGVGVKKSNGAEGGVRSRLSIPIRLKFTPAELLAGLYKEPRSNARIFWSAFSFQFGFDGLPGSFDSRDFDGPANFRVESSFLGTYVLQIDGVRIYDALSGHLRRRDRYASN